ncbi:hypothetical protein IV102_11420 [bacterium]|nr:hypothetical protein [bacterium]
MLQPAPRGRFSGLLAQDVVAPKASLPGAASDLLEITYQPSSWRTRVLIPHLKRGLVGVALLVLLGTGFLAYRSHQQSLDRQLALSHLTQSGLALEKHDLLLATSEAESAVAAARRSGDSAVLMEAHGSAAELAARRLQWQSAVSHYQAVVDLGGVEGLPKLSEARQKLRKQQRAEATAKLAQARQFIARRDYAEALKCTAAADQLYLDNQGTARQLAESHYLNGLVFDRLGLPQDALQHGRAALACDPHHLKALRLVAKLTAPPPRPKEPVRVPVISPPAAQAPVPEVISPRLGSGSSYPTYQKPDEDEDEHSSPSDTRPLGLSRSRSSSSYRRSTRSGNPGYPTYQPPKKRANEHSAATGTQKVND